MELFFFIVIGIKLIIFFALMYQTLVVWVGTIKQLETLALLLYILNFYGVFHVNVASIFQLGVKIDTVTLQTVVQKPMSILCISILFL